MTTTMTPSDLTYFLMLAMGIQLLCLAFTLSAFRYFVLQHEGRANATITIIMSGRGRSITNRAFRAWATPQFYWLRKYAQVILILMIISLLIAIGWEAYLVYNIRETLISPNN